MTTKNDLTACFPGDQGELSHELRVVLIRLLIGPLFDGAENREAWFALKTNERLIRSRLNDLYLELILDDDQMIAFVRQIQIDGGKVPVMLRIQNLTPLDSAMMLNLRLMTLRHETDGSRVAVGESELVDAIRPYLCADFDDVKVRQRAQTVINRMCDMSVLKALGESGRYQISPVLKMIMSSDVVEQMTGRFNALLADQAQKDEAEIEEQTESHG